MTTRLRRILFLLGGLGMLLVGINVLCSVILFGDWSTPHPFIFLAVCGVYEWRIVRHRRHVLRTRGTVPTPSVGLLTEEGTRNLLRGTNLDVLFFILWFVLVARPFALRYRADPPPPRAAQPIEVISCPQESS